MSEARLLLVISSVAAAIAEGRCTEELEILAAAFTMLGDALAVITVQRSACEVRAETGLPTL